MEEIGDPLDLVGGFWFHHVKHMEDDLQWLLDQDFFTVVSCHNMYPTNWRLFNDWIYHHYFVVSLKNNVPRDGKNNEKHHFQSTKQ